MDKIAKEGLLKWILRQLENHYLPTSKLVHQIILSKSDYDTLKREVFIIRDTVSSMKKDAVD